MINRIKNKKYIKMILKSISDVFIDILPKDLL